MFRCQREPLQSIRKSLLGKLNLKSEPQLPAGGLDPIMKQWRTTFNDTPRKAENSAGKYNPQIPHAVPTSSLTHWPLTPLLPVPAVADSSASPEGDNSTSLKCCPVASEVFLTGMQQRLFASTWAYICRNRAVRDKIHHFICQSSDGTAGWSTLRASPWSPVPSVTTKAPLSSVRHPSLAARTPTHRSNSNWY